MKENQYIDVFKNKNDIQKIKQYFIELSQEEEKHVTHSVEKIRIAALRSLILFTFGINTPLKFNELIELKWCEFLNDDYMIKSYFKYSTAHSDFKIYINKSCKETILLFLKQFREHININDYIYPGRENNPLTTRAYNLILKNACKNCNIELDITPMSLRKTFTYWQIQYSNYDYNKLIQLQKMLSQDNLDLAFTFKYANIEIDFEIDFFVNEVNL